MTFSVPMALEDFVPLVLGSIALFVLGDVLTREHPSAQRFSRAGVVLITLGGLSKATWKLVLALSDQRINLVALDHALFFLLAAGFIHLSAALWAVRSSNLRLLRVATPLAAAVVTLCLLLLLSDVKGYRAVLITFLSLGSTVALVASALEARRRGSLFAAATITFYLLASFALQALGRGQRSVAQQWAAQSINTVGTFVLLIGALQLRRLEARKLRDAKP